MEQRTCARSSPWPLALALSAGLLASFAGSAAAQPALPAPRPTPPVPFPSAENRVAPLLAQPAFPMERRIAGETLLVVAEGTVYVLRGDTLLAFDAQTLQLKAQAQLPSTTRRANMRRYADPNDTAPPPAVIRPAPFDTPTPDVTPLTPPPPTRPRVPPPPPKPDAPTPVDPGSR
jgi:hypothetical protein